MNKLTRKKINAIIYDVALDIEQELTGKNVDFLLAEMAGVKPENVSDIALKCAIKEVKDALNPETEGKPG